MWALAWAFWLPCLPHAAAGLHVDIDGARLPVALRGEVAYVELGAFAAARFLEYEYSYVDDVYVLRNARPDGGMAELRFQPGQREVLVDDAVVPLANAAVSTEDGLIVPLRDFTRLVLGAEAAAAIQVVPDEGQAARLLEITARPRQDTTKLIFLWDGEPKVQLRSYPERRELELLFDGAVPGETALRRRLDHPLVESLHLVADPDLLQLRAVLALRGPVRTEGFFLRSSQQYVLTVSPPRSRASLGYQVAETVAGAERAFLSRVVLGLDASHGGGDSGALGPGERTEKQFVLAVAKQIQALCKKTGIAVKLVRADDQQLPMHRRVHAINRERYRAVLTLHARSQQPTQATSMPVLFVLPPPADPAGSAGDPAAELDALRGPNADERAEARRFADTLAKSFGRRLGGVAPVVEDPVLLPAVRVLTPAVNVDLGPLEAFEGPASSEFKDDPRRQRLAFAAYQGILEYFRGLRGRRAPAARRPAAAPGASDAAGEPPPLGGPPPVGEALPAEAYGGYE